MSTLKPALIALSLMLVAPMAVQAAEITLVPAVKLQIGDRDNNGHYWDGGRWRDHDWWKAHYDWRDNHWRPHDEHRDRDDHHRHDDRRGPEAPLTQTRQLAGLSLLLVTLKHQLVFPDDASSKKYPSLLKPVSCSGFVRRF